MSEDGQDSGLLAAPHPPFGHLLPADGEKEGASRSFIGNCLPIDPLIRPFGPPSPRRGEGEIRGEAVVTAARQWVGTPYRHQGSLKCVGCDCLGLVRGVWRDLYGGEPEAPGAYQPDWAERGGEERLMGAALRHFGAALSVAGMRAGDVLLFRWREGMPAKHAGIFCGDGRFIHAYEQAAVVESALVPSWRRRIAAVHRFPGKG